MAVIYINNLKKAEKTLKYLRKFDRKYYSYLLIHPQFRILILIILTFLCQYFIRYKTYGNHLDPLNRFLLPLEGFYYT